MALPISSRRPPRQTAAIQQVSVLQDLQEVTGSWRQRGVDAAANDPPPSFSTVPAPQSRQQDSPSLNPPEMTRPALTDGPNKQNTRSVLIDAHPIPRNQSPPAGALSSPRQTTNEQLNQLRVEPRRGGSNTLRDVRGQPAVRKSGPFVQGLEGNIAQEQLPAGETQPLRTCDDYRDELMNQRITDVVVDASAPRWQTSEAVTAPTRTWTDCWGDVIGHGTLKSLEKSYIVIEDENGELMQVPTVWLSDADMVAVSEYWAVPVECGLGCFKFEGRQWAANTVAWKASALCHNPLYFENIQLERYGHTHGPLMQPVQSTAHFFVSLVTWPYQAGINPPNECQYALGFYRPGDCAPWLKNPIPISLRGGLYQAGAIVGAAAIIP